MWKAVLAAVVLSTGLAAPATAAVDRCGANLAEWSGVYTGTNTVSGDEITVRVDNDRATVTTADPWLNTTGAWAHQDVWNNRHMLLWSANDRFAYWLRNPRCAGGKVTTATLFAQNDFEQKLVEAGVKR